MKIIRYSQSAPTPAAPSPTAGLTPPSMDPNAPGLGVPETNPAMKDNPTVTQMQNLMRQLDALNFQTLTNPNDKMAAQQMAEQLEMLSSKLKQVAAKQSPI